MGHIIKDILRNSTTRILVIIFGFLFFITAYFIISNYYTQLNIYKEKELTKLKSIANTLSLEVDGHAHEILMDRYKKKDGIRTNDENAIYKSIHKKLKAAQEVNNIETTIYTMVYDSVKKAFYFGVSTSEVPFFRHEYKHYPEKLKNHYKEGGVIPPYEDENGTWLSAFSPITDHKGNVTGVLQVDERFDNFIMAANKAILRNALISLGIFIVISFFLLRTIKSILRKEDTMKRQILTSNKVIEQKNKDITDSIQYARKIQDALLPSQKEFTAHFDDAFILYMPRDIVSGDFYWYAEQGDEIILAVVDCTGHGVPGAFMSMIGNTILNEIVKMKGITEPSEVLTILDKEVQEALKQDGKVESRDGMDMSLCTIKKDFSLIKYAGALRPLIQIRDKQVTEIKGDRFPIGGGDFYDKSTGFTTHTVQTRTGDSYFMYSDGYPDQFGGDKGKKFMNKKFKRILLEKQESSISDLDADLERIIHDWMHEHEQVDDILVVGFKVS